MKKNFLFAILAIMAIAMGIISHNLPTKFSQLEVANLEALTEESEYVIGPPGTNWKTYRIQCQYTVGIDYIVVVTKTTTYWTDACGFGVGTCWNMAGC